MQTSECQECPLSTTVGGDERQHPGQLHKHVQHLGERCSPLSGGLSFFCKPSIHTTVTTDTIDTTTDGDTVQLLLVVKAQSTRWWNHASIQRCAWAAWWFNGWVSAGRLWVWSPAGSNQRQAGTQYLAFLFLTLGEIGGWGRHPSMPECDTALS